METIKQNLVEANRLHRCDYCLGIINKGEKYRKSVHKHDGNIYTWKSHKLCQKLVSELDMFEDTGGDGVTTEFFIEIVKEEYQNIMSNHYNELYESANFCYPLFKNQLQFVLNHYKIGGDEI